MLTPIDCGHDSERLRTVLWRKGDNIPLDWGQQSTVLGMLSQIIGIPQKRDINAKFPRLVSAVYTAYVVSNGTRLRPGDSLSSDDKILRLRDTRGYLEVIAIPGDGR